MPLARRVADAETSQSELRTLVSQLQSHVGTGVCPLCGQDHGSRDQLLQRIQKHAAADAASGARAHLTAIRERAKALLERVAVNKQKQESAESQITSLKHDYRRLETEIGQFTAAASKLALAVESAGPSLAEQAQAVITRRQQEVAQLGKLAQETATAIDAAGIAVANAKKAVAARKSRPTNRGRAVALAGGTEPLTLGPSVDPILLDSEPGQIAELEKLNLEELNKLKAEATKEEAEANQKKPELNGLRQEAAALKTQLATLRTQLSNLQNVVTQITVRLEESQLPATASEEHLLSMVADQSRLQTQLLALKDAASSLEIAMDAATTAAALTTLQQTIRNREKELEQAVAKRKRYLPWLKHFEEVSKMLSSQRNEATANFTREYGPRTSIIQRRLPTSMDSMTSKSKVASERSASESAPS